MQAETRRRRGVSQYKQPHILYKKGLELMEQLFPGYKQELSKAGALDIDQVRDIYFVSAAAALLISCSSFCISCADVLLMQCAFSY